jgi:2-polyprenyl-3-methyl-5-hydroxy-6-metoxy-1,4-benzoquinol methylase
MKCIYCKDLNLDLIESFRDLRTISSDCKPWRKGFVMAVCKNCGFPQAGVTPEWEDSAAEIYNAYATYFQTSDIDQAVFIDGRKSLRSDLLVNAVLEQHRPEIGANLLDFGCGSGNLLRSFSKFRPDLSLFGFDLDTRELESLKSIKNFKQLIVGEMRTDLRFNLISMSHTLEHLTEPIQAIQQLSQILDEDGCLVIAVPDCSLDPFKLLIADHCSHFSVDTLSTFLTNSGFNIVHIESRLETRECWAVCKKEKHMQKEKLPVKNLAWLEESVNWISVVRSDARKFAKEHPFGIFGTSINALWLFGELELDVNFFVDEDVSRQGTRLFGRPVISPSEVAGGSVVYLPFVPALATKIALRLEKEGVSWLVPPSGDLFT